MQQYKPRQKTKGRKQDLPDVLQLMNLWYRDVLVMKSTHGSGRPVFREEETELRRQAEQITFRKIEENIEAIENMQARLTANVNTEVALEVLLYTLRG